MVKLKYGNTNTFFIDGLLVDTDYAGTLPGFFKAIKSGGISLSDIRYVFATHYHPDHVGLVSALMELGTELLLMEHQVPFVHFADRIFGRDPRLDCKPIDESKAVVIRCEESREFLRGLEIGGEIVPTFSHSGDGAALILDSGECFVGDLEPLGWLGAYEENPALQMPEAFFNPNKMPRGSEEDFCQAIMSVKDITLKDWELILSRRPKIIYYGHANEKFLN